MGMKKRKLTQIDTSEKPRRGRPKATRIFVHKLDKIIAAKSRLGLPDAVLTFRDIRTEIYNRSGVWVSMGTVYRFVEGIEPVHERIRKAFGLACKVEVLPCKKCGEIHFPKRCTKRNPITTPRRNWKKDYNWLASMFFYMIRNKTQ
jgi:hypothetical protein